MRCVLLAICAVLSFQWPAMAGSMLRLSGNQLKWNSPRLTLKISRTVHLPEGDLGVDRRDSPEVVYAAVAESVREWVEATDPALEVAIELTDNTVAGGTDNLVTFTDPAPYENGFCSKDFVACAVLGYDPATGEIVTASVAFNPAKRHSARGYDGTNDIGLVMLHEFGHIMGLDHSPLGNAVMAPAAELESTGFTGTRYAPRQLSWDDTSTLRAAYGFPIEVASITGAVRYNGQPVPGAHVVAMTENGLAITSSQSQTDGSYRLQVPPGSYYLLAEPLDGPVTTPGPVFATAFWNKTGGHRQDAELVNAAAGETRSGIDFLVAAGPLANIVNIGTRVNGRYVGFPRTTMARGREYELGIGRTPAGTPGAMALMRYQVELLGDPFPSPNSPSFLYQRLRIPADAPLGNYSAQFSTGDAIAAVTGGVAIVPNPSITAVEGTPGPGQVVTIRGTDLAGRELSRTPWMEGAPLPTQLAGTTVLANGLYCELLSVKPEEVVAILPLSADPATVTLSVLTGLGVESNSWDLTPPPPPSE